MMLRVLVELESGGLLGTRTNVAKRGFCYMLVEVAALRRKVRKDLVIHWVYQVGPFG